MDIETIFFLLLIFLLTDYLLLLFLSSKLASLAAFVVIIALIIYHQRHPEIPINFSIFKRIKLIIERQIIKWQLKRLEKKESE